MQPSKLDLHIIQGATYRQDFVWYYRAENSDTFDFIDLSECTIAMQIRSSHSSDRVILDLGENGYIWISDPASGKVQIEIPASETSLLDFSHAVYDVEITFTNGDVVRFIEGNITLSPEVTR